MTCWKCEEGDLNPKLLVKILKVFASPTPKNRHLPPRSVSSGHKVAVAADLDCARAALGPRQRLAPHGSAADVLLGITTARTVPLREDASGNGNGHTRHNECPTRYGPITIRRHRAP